MSLAELSLTRQRLRPFGAPSGRRARLLTRLAVGCAVAAAFGWLSLSALHDADARHAAEARAARAEAQLVQVQAEVQRLEAAQATAAAFEREPREALQRLLDAVLNTYRAPSPGAIESLTQGFADTPLAMVRPEADRLKAGGLHLDGASGYTLAVASSVRQGDQATLRTHEVWTYDERNAQGSRGRCVREESDQTYALAQSNGTWRVEQIALEGLKRTDCPAG